MIIITLQSTVVAAGGPVNGIVTWTPDKPVNPKEMSVQIGWRTEGRGDKNSAIVNKAQLYPGPGGFMPPVSLPFALLLPPEGPLTYDGKLLRIIWEVQVQITLSGIRNEKSVLPFRVLPVMLRPI